MTAANWVTLAIAALTFLGTWLTVRSQQRRDRYDQAAKVTASALTLLEPLEASIARLDAELKTEKQAREVLEAELIEQRDRRTTLENRVRKLENFLVSEGYDLEHI